MQQDDWKSTRRIASSYLHDIDAWIEAFLPWQIEGGSLDPQLLLIRERRNEQLARDMAEAIARRMVSGVAVTNARSWRAAAARSLRGKEVYQALKTEMRGPVGARVNELVQANAKRILSLPDDLALRASRYIATEQRKGTRAAAIAATLERRMPELAQSRARMLARTGVGAAETALTRARAERLGMTWYQWATSEDSRVRPSHKLMDKVLVAWADAPSPEMLAGEGNPFGHYAPGTVPNCRCIALPLIDLNEIRWPVKVYQHGHIEFMGRAQFAKLIDLPRAA
jgi:SPP1 gp7 family putative phage head morphogenesis protein